MVRRRFLIPAIGSVLLSASFFTLVWITERHLFVGDSRSSFFFSSLATFRTARPRPDNLGTRLENNKQRELDGISAKDVICGGCYHAIAKREANLRCGHLITKLMKAKGQSLKDAALDLTSQEEYEEQCARCHPGACSSEDTIYWRYDSKHHSPPILASVVPKLNSIPTNQRIPPSAIDNLEAFFSQSNNAMPPLRYLFDYNPSILILPPSFDKSGFPKEDTPIYLASFRVSTQQSCFKPVQTMAMYGGSWDRKPPVKNFLALALLRDDLSIIEDVVVDIKSSGVFQHFAEDFRLFLFENEIYLGSFDLIAPILITRHPESKGTATGMDGYTLLMNVFPSPLKIAIRAFPSCPVCLNRPNKQCGKNFNYFSTASDKVWVELWPSGPHVAQRVNLKQPCSVSRATTEESELEIYSDATFRPPQPSWYTMEEVMFPSMEPKETLLTRARGGACCISIEDPRTGNELLVGIYHTKIPKFGERSGKALPQWKQQNSNTSKIVTNQYLSRWYAFQATPPFPVVAKSGLFCLGFPGSLEQEQHPLIKATLWKTIIFGGDGLGAMDAQSSMVLECPRIHFISGMSQKANDPSSVLVAYGFNDCVSRLIEIEKEAIVAALFP